MSRSSESLLRSTTEPPTESEDDGFTPLCGVLWEQVDVAVVASRCDPAKMNPPVLTLRVKAGLTDYSLTVFNAWRFNSSLYKAYLNSYKLTHYIVALYTNLHAALRLQNNNFHTTIHSKYNLRLGL